MAISEENVNNVDKVGAQSFLASTSTIKKGSMTLHLLIFFLGLMVHYKPKQYN